MNAKLARLVWLVFAVMALTVTNAAWAQQVSASNASGTDSPWTVEIGLYGFVPLSVEGSSTVDGGTVDLDLGPSEIFDLFQFAISGRVEAWRDLGKADGSALGIVFDAQYVDLGEEPSGIGPGGAGEVDIDIQQGIVELLAGYRFPRVDLDDSGSQALVFDVMGGARYNYLRQKIDVTPGLAAPFTENLGGDERWVEPVFGGRVTWVINDRWNANLRGDLAGFGVSGDDLTWSLTGIVGWRAWENITLRLGYRVYDMDYSTGSGASEFAFDATENGPFLGVTYRF